MLVMGVKPGHDGALAVIEDGELVLSLEAEKDSYPRHAELTPATLLDTAAHIGRRPDVVALGGWRATGGSAHKEIGAGYHGTAPPVRRETEFFGAGTALVTSSHVRSHIMTAIGLAPDRRPQRQAVLVWEGVTGGFYLVDEGFRVERDVPVLPQVGGRYAFLFAIADPTFPDTGAVPDLDASGKLMALAAYGAAGDADTAIRDAVERILKVDSVYPAPKEEFRDAPFYNAGVRSPAATTAAALMNQRVFEVFAGAAAERLPRGLPLRVAGGCGLNCDWNAMWRDSGLFSSVFVPPCPNDAGSALGTAIDAQCAATGSPFVDWDVYRGLRPVRDTRPDPAVWRETPLDHRALAATLARGDVVAWVRGRWEIGPRALGARSLLAEPFHARTRDRLNAIKQREDYRPIAPCCRDEDVPEVFEEDFPDPHMLYFRRVRRGDLGAVTHVDGSARVQTVSQRANRPLHDLLSAFAELRGVGVLCNTSLNFKGRGFVNTVSELVEFCDLHGIDHMVVDGTWFRRRG